MKLDADGFVKRSDQVHSVGFPPPRQPDYGFDVISEAFQRQSCDPQKHRTSVLPPKDNSMKHQVPSYGPSALGAPGPALPMIAPGLPALKSTGQYLGLKNVPVAPPSKGPNTYFNGLLQGDPAPTQGWPTDQALEDAFDLPPRAVETSKVDRQYAAEFTASGGVELILTTTSTYETKRTIGSFDTMADAQLAAKALNTHHGY